MALAHHFSPPCATPPDLHQRGPVPTERLAARIPLLITPPGGWSGVPRTWQRSSLGLKVRRGLICSPRAPRTQLATVCPPRRTPPRARSPPPRAVPAHGVRGRLFERYYRIATQLLLSAPIDDLTFAPTSPSAAALPAVALTGPGPSPSRPRPNAPRPSLVDPSSTSLFTRRSSTAAQEMPDSQLYAAPVFVLALYSQHVGPPTAASCLRSP